MLQHCSFSETVNRFFGFSRRETLSATRGSSTFGRKTDETVFGFDEDNEEPSTSATECASAHEQDLSNDDEDAFTWGTRELRLLPSSRDGL